MTQEKKTVEVWAERAERAAEAESDALGRIRELEGERPVFAVAAFEGGEGDRERLRELDAKIAELKQEAELSAAVANDSATAVKDLRSLEEEERRRSEEEGKRARYNEIASQRERIEAQATTAMLDLVEALGELSELDTEQRIAAREAGVLDALNRGPWKTVTNVWIGAYLREHAPDLSFRPGYRKLLSELNPMPPKAPLPEDTARLAATREREHAAQRTEAERSLAAIQFAEAVDSRRRALLAQTSHESSPLAVKRDIERQIEADLAREFPGYVARQEPGYKGPPAQPGGLPGGPTFGG